MQHTPDKKEWILVFYIVITAFMLRYWHLSSTGWVSEKETAYLGMKAENHSVFHFSDAAYYHLIASDYLQGKGLNIPFPPPLFILFLISAYSILGASFFKIKLVYAAINSLSLVFIYIIARELYNKTTAFITILLSAASFTLIFICGGLNMENLYLFNLSAALCIFVLIYKEKYLWNIYISSFIFGLTSGLTALTRSEFLVILSMISILFIKRAEWGWRMKGKIFSLMTLGIAVVTTPWAYRNYIYMDNFNREHPDINLSRFVPISLNGPFNFYQGHNPMADGTYSPDAAGSLTDESYSVALSAEDKSHISYIRDGYRLGIDYIFKNPVKELLLIPKKITIFMNGFSNGFLLNNLPLGINGEVPNMADSFVSSSQWVLIAGLSIFIIGFYFLCTDKKGYIAYLPVIIICAAILINIIFYALSRLAYPFIPYYFMIISYGISRMFERINIKKALKYPVFITAVTCLLITGYAQSRGLTIVKKFYSGRLGRYLVIYDRKMN